MQKLKSWLYAIAIFIFSVLLVVYAYDIEQSNPIGVSSSQAGKQEMLIWLADVLGFKVSIAVAVLATSAGFYFAIQQKSSNLNK